MTIKGTPIENTIKFFDEFCKKNDISMPEPIVMGDIIKDITYLYGSKDFSMLTYAFRNWQMGYFKNIRKPRNLNAHFIGEIIVAFQDFKTGGAKGQGIEKKPTPRPYNSTTWTDEEKHKTAIGCWTLGYNKLKGMVHSKERPSRLVRTLWVTWAVARDYQIDVPSEADPLWIDNLKKWDLRNMDKDAWSSLIEDRRKHGQNKEADEDLFTKASIMAEYFDTIPSLPELNINDRL